MEKEKVIDPKKMKDDEKIKDEVNNSQENNNDKETKELSLEDKIKELEDKLVRSYAEMENQRRRYEKEKDDAFDYGGFSFARESLNLIDKLDR